MEIDKNIPIPKTGSGSSTLVKYPYDKLNIGDSYFCESISGVSCARMWAKNNKKNIKFTQRKEGIGFRVWRTK
jgi:hypothetical protein